MPYATHILKKARQFHDDKSGATAVIFGVAATMLVTVMGAAIDTARMIQAKNKIQSSADTAVLMAKKTETQLRTTMSESAAKTQATARAKEFFEASIGDAKTYFEGHKVNFDLKFGMANDATLNVDGDYKFIVGNFVGLQKQKLVAKAVAQFKEPDDVEVVLALDMTGSMFEKDGRPTTRFTLLRNASKTFTHMLFDASKDVGKDYIRVGVVPWGTTVNILSEAPAAPDFNGANTVTSMPDAGSRTLVASPLSRASDINVDNADYAPVNWRGCIIGLTEPMGTYNDNKHTAPFKPMITPRTNLPTVNIKIRNACDTETYARRSFNAGSYGNTNVYLKNAQQTTAMTSSSSTCQ
ncbi:MAG: TadE/TadG family type IV pilus assembly protein, partial [Beijerinckiaceae bacterium]